MTDEELIARAREVGPQLLGRDGDDVARYDWQDRDWPCCEHCAHDPGHRHADPCITCQYDLPDYDRN